MFSDAKFFTHFIRSSHMTENIDTINKHWFSPWRKNYCVFLKPYTCILSDHPCVLVCEQRVPALPGLPNSRPYARGTSEVSVYHWVVQNKGNIDWLIDRSTIDWLIDCLIDWFFELLIVRCIDGSIDWLVDWLFDCLIDLFIDWSMDGWID